MWKELDCHWQKKRMVASSVYCSGLMLGFASIMSRIKMEKKIGDKTDPCGKPITCGLSSEQKSFTFNFIVLLHRKPLKTLSNADGMPISSNLYNMPSSHIESNAFWKSRNNAETLCLLFYDVPRKTVGEKGKCQLKSFYENHVGMWGVSCWFRYGF